MAREGGGRLRVMHVMECTIGGTRRHLVDLCTGLLERDVDLHLVAAAERQPDFRDDLARLGEMGATVTELPMVRRIAPVRDAAQLARIAGLLRRTRPHVVHTHSSKAGVLGRLASEIDGVGVRVHTPHTFAFLFEELFGPVKRRLFFELERRLAGGCARIVAVGEDEAEGFRASGVVDAERIAVIGNGIDPAPWTAARPATVAELGLDPGRPLLVCAGLLYAAKGQDLLLDALAAPANGAWQCVFAGEGPDADALAARADALNLSDRVRWLGFRRDLPAWIAACDALALPSRWEGMPYVVLEAFAAGKPVVATPVDGARSLVGDDAGWLADAIDAGALAAALSACLSAGTRERVARGAAGCERVRTEHTLASMIDSHLALYRSVA